MSPTSTFVEMPASLSAVTSALMNSPNCVPAIDAGDGLMLSTRDCGVRNIVELCAYPRTKSSICDLLSDIPSPLFSAVGFSDLRRRVQQGPFPYQAVDFERAYESLR